MTARKRKLTVGAVVDSSAIISIFDRRPSSQAFRQALRETRPLYMSAATFVEISLVVLGKKAEAGLAPLDEMIRAFGIEIVAFDLPMAENSRKGCSAYGKGHNPASLNMGDLYSYGLAMSKNLPLFFEGLDFFQTDAQDAMAMLGYQFDKQHQPLPLGPTLSI